MIDEELLDCAAGVVQRAIADGLRREERQITSLGEWLAWRAGLLTASPIGALFGCHPHVTLEDLAAEKRGEKRGEGDNASMRRGRIFEAAVIAAIQEEHPEWSVVKANTFHILPDYRLGCTPDAFGEDGGLLIQIKTVSPHQWEAWRGHPPLHYSLQTLCELLVTGRTRGVLAVMIVNASYPVHYFDVPRHAAAEQRILDAVSSWWREFDAGRLPGAVPSAGIAAELDDGTTVDLSSNNRLCEALPVREQLKAEISAAEKQVAEIDADLKAAMGAASIGWLPGYNVTFKAQSRKEVVIPAKTFRVLRVSSVEDKQ